MSKETNLFEVASRKKLRFDTVRGQLTVEQLWDLPLTGANSLDTVAVVLDTAIRNAPPRSFVTGASSAADTVLSLQFEVVKHIIDVRLAERDSKVEEAEKESKRRLLRDAIAQREVEELLNGDVDSLKAQLKALG